MQKAVDVMMVTNKQVHTRSNDNEVFGNMDIVS